MRVVVVAACVLVAVAAWRAQRPQRTRARADWSEGSPQPHGVDGPASTKKRVDRERATEPPPTRSIAALVSDALGPDSSRWFDALCELGTLAAHDDRATEALIDLFPHNEHAWIFARSGGANATRLLLDVTHAPSHRRWAFCALAFKFWHADACAELVDGLRHADSVNSAAHALWSAKRESLTEYSEQIVDALEQIIPVTGVQRNMLILIRRIGYEAFRLRHVIEAQWEATGQKGCRRALDAIDGMPVFPY